MAVGQYNPSNFDLASVVVERGPLPGDVPKIWFRSEGGPVIDLQADGKRLGVKLTADADDYAITVDPASVPLVIDALKSAALADSGARRRQAVLPAVDQRRLGGDALDRRAAKTGRDGHGSGRDGPCAAPPRFPRRRRFRSSPRRSPAARSASR